MLLAVLLGLGMPTLSKVFTHDADVLEMMALLLPVCQTSCLYCIQASKNTPIFSTTLAMLLQYLLTGCLIQVSKQASMLKEDPLIYRVPDLCMSYSMLLVFAVHCSHSTNRCIGFCI